MPLLSRPRFLTFAALSFCSSAFAAETPFAVHIHVDAAQTHGPLKPIYRFFGADEPNYATMKDGRKLLRDIGALGEPQEYFRAHSLLVTGDGTPALKWGSTNAYTEDAQGNPIYDWTVLDRIFDAYLAGGVKPYAQIGFMPKALSIKPEPYQHEWRPGFPYSEIYTGWAYPPKDYGKWAELVYQWVTHAIARYGRAEVEQWYWEVWNEANGAYWKSTPEDWYKLHDYAIDGVRRALPTARVGGPHTAGSGGKFMRDFLQHITRGKNYATGETGTPTDFLAFHAKGNPTFVDGHVRMGIANQLRTIDDGFGIIASYPELRSRPIIIGESDPDGCAACQGPQLGYRSGTMYSSYTAAVFARKHQLAQKHGVNLEGALTWAFEFEDQPYFAGFRVLASNDIDLPVMNLFRMFSMMSGKQLPATSSAAVLLDKILREGVRGQPDVAAIAIADDDGKICILLWHYHDDDVPGPSANVQLQLTGLSGKLARISQYRIDEAHSNAFAAWKQMGSPPAPTRDQYAHLKKAGQLQLAAEAATAPITAGALAMPITLPRQAVALIVLERH